MIFSLENSTNYNIELKTKKMYIATELHPTPSLPLTKTPTKHKKSSLQLLKQESVSPSIRNLNQQEKMAVLHVTPMLSSKYATYIEVLSIHIVYRNYLQSGRILLPSLQNVLKIIWHGMSSSPIP